MPQGKEQLMEFIEDRAFKPVLDASPDRFEESEREKLEDVKGATRREVERFRDTSSMEDLVNEYREDLNSDEAKEVSRQLKDLGLPTLKDIESDVRQKVQHLGYEY